MAQEIFVTMLGASRVGKTSLLTAMYDRFEHTAKGTSLQITPDSKTSGILSSNLAELKKLDLSFEATGGVAGTEGSRKFTFDLGLLGKTSSLNIVFHDYPGGYLDSDEGQNYIGETLDNCASVLIAVDTPALIQSKEDAFFYDVHDEINRPQQITDFFKRTYTEQALEGKPRLVILGLMKCEKYVKEGREDELFQAVKDGYPSLFSYFRTFPTKIAVVIIPVQTVGCVFFSRLEKYEKGHRFIFTKNNPSDRYSPKGSEQPLRYLLRFLLKLHIDKRRSDRWIFDSLCRFFGADKKLEDAVSFFANQSNDTKCYISQGSNLLEI